METYNNIRTHQVITRAANTTAYEIGQAVQNATASALSFATSNQATLGGYITRAVLRTTKAAHTEALRLHLYSATPTLSNDLAAFILTDVSAYVGYIDFTTFVTGGTGSVIAVSEASFNRPMQFNVAAGVLFGLLEAKAAFTPTSAQEFHIALFTEVSS